MIMLVTLLSRSNALGCVTAFAICMSIVSSVLNTLCFFLKYKDVIPDNIEFTDYLVTPYSVGIKLHSDTEYITRGIIVCLIYLAVTMALSMLVIKKKDI